MFANSYTNMARITIRRHGAHDNALFEKIFKNIIRGAPISNLNHKKIGLGSNIGHFQPFQGSINEFKLRMHQVDGFPKEFCII